MTTFHRYWAAVAVDTYTEPQVFALTANRIRHVNSAVESLRQRLEGGEVPPVMLVGPERGVPIRVETNGWIRAKCYAWIERDSAAYISKSLMAGHLVVSTIEASSSTPDQRSTVHAAAGSVLLDQPMLSSLRVPDWLAPAAQQLANWYGVDVAISHPQTPLQPDRPVVFRNALTPAAVAECVDHFQRSKNEFANPYMVKVDPKDFSSTPPSVGDRIATLVERAAAELQVHANSCEARIMGYPPGSDHPWHIDAAGDLPNAEARTVSFSIMLNEQGKDFTGGDFQTPTDTVTLSAGDMVAFTATTPHHVTPIENGYRLVLVCFGMYLR